jgi:hypothetical protein
MVESCWDITTHSKGWASSSKIAIHYAAYEILHSQSSVAYAISIPVVKQDVINCGRFKLIEG